ncbi:CYFA0S01e13476g1_1 [Cyberlindnera fabianii]|uniref:DNA-directed RNA polymerase III subunit n=1 Tax=Cyberlindnera fabianii TaxID=36022 RepID=A0A061AJ99_CYBFA|nr:CYFA0S01e13476g1_1 [Cyberlindnera fabianii]
MSFRGGRGGGASGFQRNLPFGLDYQDVNKPQETEKPTLLLPVNGPLTDKEKVAASHYISFQNTLRDGPFFTGDSLDVEDVKSKLEISEDGINDGLKRYSDRYLKKRKIGPSIDDHPYKIEFFPQELYKVMGVDDKKKKKLLAISQVTNSKDVLLKLENDDLAHSIAEKLKNVADDDDEKEEEPKEPVEENWDDEFEDEDDDDDYNAEKYFDDGEEFGDEDDYNDEAAF